MTAQTIHFRHWHGRYATPVCHPNGRAHTTTSPNADKVTCHRCKAVLAEVARRAEREGA